MSEPAKKHLYQARSILRQLCADQIDRMDDLNEQKFNEINNGEIGYFSKRVASLCDAIAVLDTFGLDDWARIQMNPENGEYPSMPEYEVNFE